MFHKTPRESPASVLTYKATLKLEKQLNMLELSDLAYLPPSHHAFTSSDIAIVLAYRMIAIVLLPADVFS